MTDTPHRHKHVYSKLRTKCNIYDKDVWPCKIPMINTNKNTLDAKLAPLAALEITENLQCRQWRRPHENRQRLRVDDVPELYSLVINGAIVRTQQSPVAPRAASKQAPGATSDYKAVTPTDWCLIYKSDISYNNAVQIWHEHVGPGHDLMKDLNSYNDCAAFIFIGKERSPYVVVILRGCINLHLPLVS